MRHCTHRRPKKHRQVRPGAAGELADFLIALGLLTAVSVVTVCGATVLAIALLDTIARSTQ